MTASPGFPPARLDVERIRALARRCGFDDAGVAPPTLPEEADHLDRWLAAGYAGGMDWLARDRDLRLDLRHRFPWARSVVVVLRAYRPDPSSSPPADGLARHVSTYAWGDDYHDVLLPDLERLAAALGSESVGGGSRWHAYVDTGPVLERQLARVAGLGWLGKNTLLMNARGGSWFFLGVLVTDLGLVPGRPVRTSCGTCRACQPACPTGAFVAEGVLDASRCISYLTIEHRGPIERGLRRAMGEWVFGCDLCQTACPFNFGVAPAGDPALAWKDAVAGISLREVLHLTEDGFRGRFRRTALWRPRREGLLRNALIVVANARRMDCRREVRRLLADDSPVLREAASWCLAELGDAGSLPALQHAADRETQAWVREDLRRLALVERRPT
jgi:epoxyqueuosine reductase